MPMDLNNQFAGQLTVIAQQGVAENQRLAEMSELAFQKDLFQGAQGETPAILQSLRQGDRTPVVKTAPGRG